MLTIIQQLRAGAIPSDLDPLFTTDCPVPYQDCPTITSTKWKATAGHLARITSINKQADDSGLQLSMTVPCITDRTVAGIYRLQALPFETSDTHQWSRLTLPENAQVWLDSQGLALPPHPGPGLCTLDVDHQTCTPVQPPAGVNTLLAVPAGYPFLNTTTGTVITRQGPRVLMAANTPTTVVYDCPNKAAEETSLKGTTQIIMEPGCSIRIPALQKKLDSPVALQPPTIKDSLLAPPFLTLKRGAIRLTLPPQSDLRAIIPGWTALSQHLAEAYIYYVLAGVVLLTSTFCSMLLYTWPRLQTLRRQALYVVRHE
jgi:hypothetical protein